MPLPYQDSAPRPNPGRKRSPYRWLTALLAIYALVLLVPTVSNLIGPELWWFGSLNLYLPQWLWALPGVPLLLLTGVLAPRRAWAPLLCLLWVAGPLMGLCWHPQRASGGKGISLRVMDYNVKWGYRDGNAIARDVAAFHPDLLQMQDGTGVLDGPLGRLLSGWTVRVSGQYIVASRLPLSELESKDISFPGGHHHCVRATLTVHGVPITIYNVHLLSPREGLVAVKGRQIEGMEGNVSDRLAQADRLAGYLRQEHGPLIVTGDMNSPIQALTCRKLFGTGMRDAFSTAGFGYGYTYGQYTRIHRPFVRIDHILINSPWQVRDCRVGNEWGSDHSPVIADLFLPTGSQ